MSLLTNEVINDDNQRYKDYGYVNNSDNSSDDELFSSKCNNESENNEGKEEEEEEEELEHFIRDVPYEELINEDGSDDEYIGSKMSGFVENNYENMISSHAMFDRQLFELEMDYENSLKSSVIQQPLSTTTTTTITHRGVLNNYSDGDNKRSDELSETATNICRSSIDPKIYFSDLKYENRTNANEPLISVAPLDSEKIMKIKMYMTELSIPIRPQLDKIIERTVDIKLESNSLREK